MVFNKTRKNRKQVNKRKCCNNHNECKLYSEGFRRRMTDEITFVPYIPSPEELARINEISKKHHNPQLDKESQDYIQNYPKYRAEYLESVKNRTNIY